MQAIHVRGVSKRFGSVTAVDDLSFDVDRGTVTGFVGPNGAGKTTTLRILLGLTRPDAGEARIDGQRYRDLAHPVQHVGAVVDSGFHPGRSGRDHLRVVATAAGVPRHRVDDVLERVDLIHAATRKVAGYSHGMRQRLALATALLGDPPLLVLDEPTNGLDPEGVHWLRRVLREHADAGGTVLVSSHLLAELALSADAVVIIKAGRLVAQGSVEDLTSRLTGGVHVRSPDADRLVTALIARGIAARRVGPDEVVADGATPDAVGAAIAATRTVVYEVRLERPDLEATVLSLTGDGGGEQR